MHGVHGKTFKLTNERTSTCPSDFVDPEDIISDLILVPNMEISLANMDNIQSMS